jgi:hypothetical protein
MAYATYATYAEYRQLGQGSRKVLSYAKITDARAHLKDIYDSAQRGVPSVVQREQDAPIVIVRADDFKRSLRALCAIEPQVRFTDSSVSMWLPGLPVSAEGTDFETAEAGFIAALRDYAELWAEDLSDYPNHADNWGLVNLVMLSSDEELRAHAFGEG